MNEEKKLTDEEIVKALEICAKELTCTKCPYRHECCSKESSSGLLLYGVDLIYRLQDEKQKVVQDYYCEAQHCDVQKDIIEKQKAEIERLTEERDVYLDDCSAVRHKLRQEIEEKFELQKQVDELKAENTELYKEHTTLITGSILQKKQAVKDTAKEILQEIDKSDILVVETKEYGEIEVVSIERLKEIIKRKGVEVE